MSPSSALAFATAAVTHSSSLSSSPLVYYCPLLLAQKHRQQQQQQQYQTCAPLTAAAATNTFGYGFMNGPSSFHGRLTRVPLSLSSNNQQNDEELVEDDEEDEESFLKRELARLEALEEILAELELGDPHFDNDDNENDDDDYSWQDLFDATEDADPEELKEWEQRLVAENPPEVSDDTPEQSRSTATTTKTTSSKSSSSQLDSLEKALLQGVVPANAGVGSRCLAGDFGFDPWKLSQRDTIGQVQGMVQSWFGGGPDHATTTTTTTSNTTTKTRPSALVLRDYREAELRHGRLAMLAAVLWPLQEMLDRLLLDDGQFGSLLYSHVTLPYIPLLMTAIMLLLGYLDIYSKSIKDMEELGEAFLPGDCFWDPLRILEGAPDYMKRNMQERELFNGRTAMLAVVAYIFEEATTHLPIITIPGNELLFEPAYQVPFIQKWLDTIFQSPSPTFTFPEIGTVDFVETMKEVMQEEETLLQLQQIAEQAIGPS